MFICSQKELSALLLGFSVFVFRPLNAAPLDVDLAIGTIASGAFVVAEFEVFGNVDTSESLILSTAGSGFDTELAIYDSGGRLLATNDDAQAGTGVSEIAFGRSRSLPAGRYFAVLTGFNSFFADNSINPGSSRGGNFRLAVRSSIAGVDVVSPGYRTADGLILPASIHEISLMTGILSPFAIQRVDFRLEQEIGGGQWLAIHTMGSNFDTEIGLYDSTGNLVASNDDVVPGAGTSRLSFGLDGDDGRSLPAGAYSLLLGGFNTFFRSGFSANSSWSRTGSYAVYVQSSTDISMLNDARLTAGRPVSEPSVLWLAAAGIGAWLMRRKNVTGANMLFLK